MIKKIKAALFCIVFFLPISCNYLDIVPDNVATLDNAFTMRNEAEKYLFTCYRYLPSYASPGENPAFTAGDEFWFYYPFVGFSAPAWEIARGNQSVVEPVMNFWNGMTQPFRGIRDCNIFIENIDRVPDMDDMEKARWKAEALFLKAYYHFWLLRMYGPIPVIRENLPISAGPDEVKAPREPVDEVVNYIVELLDQASPNLPLKIDDRLTELGRITRPIALSVKAQVLVTAASPLFNGNTEYSGFINDEGVPYFNQEVSMAKWQQAVDACREAYELCRAQGYSLHYFEPGLTQTGLSDETIFHMNVRTSLTEPWNNEVIWGSTNSRAGNLQRESTPPLDPSNVANANTRGNLAPPLKIAEMFYSSNGVPISEDVNYAYDERYNLRETSEADAYRLQSNYTTVGLHFDREPRFYASLGFDGGLWYGQGRLDDKNPWLIQARLGQSQSRVSSNRYSVTGYWPKKLVNYENVIGTGNTYTVQVYPWPVMRLADLMLLYAEALNELNGPSQEVYDLINPIRERAGLLPVEVAWPQYSRQPDKINSREGMRSIIQQERLIELVFEGKRFWDLRRWKRAHIELNNLVTGWDIDQESPENYYRVRTLFNQTFMMRDYFWPIRENELIINRNLDQNPGW